MEYLKRINYFKSFTLLFIAVSVALTVLSLGVFYYEQLRLKNNLEHTKVNLELEVKKEKFNYETQHFETFIQAVLSSKFFNQYLKDASSKNYSDCTDFFTSIAFLDKDIMQLRYIDEKGMERIRIDRLHKGDTPLVIAQDKLQNKAKRDYFFKSVHNAPNQLYISDLNLNMEHGKIEVPHKPVLRFALPVYQDEESKGIVILNIFMDTILKELTASQFFYFYLYDQDHALLTSNNPNSAPWSRYLHTSWSFENTKILRTIPLQKGLSQETLYLGVAPLKADGWNFSYIGHMMLILTFFIIPLATLLGYFIALIPKRLFDQLQEQQKMLIQQSKLAAMGEMISAIAHQWRQPLNAVGVLSQEIQLKYQYDKLSKKDLNNLSEEIQEYLEYMSKTIDDFRDFFKPSKEIKNFDVVQVIHSALNIVGKQLENHNIEFTLDVKCSDKTIEDPSKAYVISGYESQFKQVIINLINNAKEAIEEYAKKVTLTQKTIHIDILRETQNLTITVTDNGGGIPLKILDKIFEPYISTKEEQQGTGLGLYMSKLIIERNMLGQLRASNTPSGAKFEIALHP